MLHGNSTLPTYPTDKIICPIEDHFRKPILMYEIERKFHVNQSVNSILAQANCIRRFNISQIYLTDTGKWSQRVRQITDEDRNISYILTMKRKVSDRKCIELETKVSQELYDIYAKVGTPPLIKQRCEVLIHGTWWHIDQFLDPEYSTVVFAEIELSSEYEEFVKPEWLGEEVTGWKSCKNAVMAKRLGEMRAA